MRFLALLPFVLVACTTVMKSAHRSPASHQEEMAKLGPVSPEMKEKLIAAVFDMLDYGNNMSARGQHLASVNQEAVELLRILGVSEEVIEKKVTNRLNTFLEQGRREGLARAERTFDESLPKEIRENGISPDPSVPSSDTSFLAKYDLTPYKNLRAKIGRIDAFKMASSYYATSTDHAFNLALTINNDYLADQAIFQTLQLDGHERAYKSLEKIGDNAGIMTVGFLALTDYYHEKNIHMPRMNLLREAIEAFKRVQGPLKPKANQVMIDLAKDLAYEKGFANKHEHQEKLGFALRLLRSTGDLVAKVHIDSSKVNFITNVKDAAVTAEIRKILPMVLRVDDDDVIEALASIGAKDMISRIALGELLKRKTPRHGNYQFTKALKLYDIAGDREGMRKVINEMMGETASIIEDYQITGTVIPTVLELDGPKGLDKVLTMFENQISLAKKDREKARLKYRKSELEKAIAENDFSDYPQRESRSAMHPPAKRTNELVSTYESLKLSMAKHVAKLTPEERAEAKKKAQESLAEGDGWEAFNYAFRAKAKDELILAGDQLVKDRNGTNAIRPYLAAILLEQSK